MKDARIAGRLREFVAFDTPFVTGESALGRKEHEWVEVRTCRAEFIYQRGSEEIDAARLQGRSVFKVRIRKLGTARSLDTSHRMRTVKHGLPDGEGVSDPLPGTRYNVLEVDAISDRKWVFLLVETSENPI